MKDLMPSAANPSSDLEDLRGLLLDERYEIGEPLSTGGMGSVYRGQQLALRRPVAIKVVKPGVNNRDMHVRRLVREAQTTALVKHPNVIEIIDVGVMEHGFVYLVMEQLEGMDLRALLRQERRLPWPRARAIAMQVVAALKAAHARDVVHRDIKPSNVFLVEQAPGIHGDFIKVLDFGLAKSYANGGSPTLTGAEEVVGTAAYLAPEVARGKQADFRSEVYAVGVLMYKMVTGTVPFKGHSPLDVLAKAISNPLPAPRTRNPDLPAEADRIIRRCLAKRPDLRPQDMDALERDLHALGGDPAIVAGFISRQTPAAPVTASRGEHTQVTRAPLAPPSSAPRFESRPPALPVPRTSLQVEDPRDVLEAAMSEVLELDVDDRVAGRSRRPLRLVPDPEPSPLPEGVSIPVLPSPEAVPEGLTSVAPVPHRPNPPRSTLAEGFASDLPRDERGFAPALSMGGPAMLPLHATTPPPAKAPKSGRGRFLALLLAVPLVAAVVVGGLWASGFMSPKDTSSSEVQVSAAAVAPDTAGSPAGPGVTWDHDFQAAPVASDPQVGEPAWFTPPMLRRPEPGAVVVPAVAVADDSDAVPAEPAAPRVVRKQRRRRASSGRSSKPASQPAQPATSQSRPPPPPPKVPLKKKPSAGDSAAPWKRVPVPSDNW